MALSSGALNTRTCHFPPTTHPYVWAVPSLDVGVASAAQLWARVSLSSKDGEASTKSSRAAGVIAIASIRSATAGSNGLVVTGGPDETSDCGPPATVHPL